MRFAYKFDRRVGAGVLPLLGSDAVPVLPAYLAGTNVYKTKLSAGFPSQRIAVSYEYTGAGVPTNLVAKGYIYDGTSEKWATVDSFSINLKPGDIAFLGIPQLIDAPQVPGGDPYVSTVDSIEFALVVQTDPLAPDGTYTFMMGMDISEIEDEGTLGMIVAQGPAGVDPWIVHEVNLDVIGKTTLPSAPGTGTHIGLDAATCPMPAGPWTSLRSFAGAVADVIDLTVLETVTGIVDLSLLAYPAALTGLALTINGQTCTFPAAHPIDLADTLVHLNAAITDCTFTAPGPGFVLVVVKDTPGNLAISGTAAAVLGLTVATTGPWIAVPSTALTAPGAVMVELGFPGTWTTANAPDEVILWLWRMNAIAGGIVERAGEIRVPAGMLGQQSRRFSFDGTHAYLTVGFVGGTAPTVTGVVQIRAVYDGDQPIADETKHAAGPNLLAKDVWDNAPTGAVSNYSCVMLDATAVRLGNDTITLTVTPPLTSPASTQIRRVRIITTTTAKPLDWEQGRNAVLTMAAAVLTVKALDGTVITVPAAATAIDVEWVGPKKDTAFEDSAHVAGEYGVKQLMRRCDVPASSAGSDGDWATANQDPDGYGYCRSKAYCSASNTERTTRADPEWSRNVATPVTIATAQAVTAAWADLGPEIPVQGYTKFGLWLNLDVNDAQNIRVRMLNKHTSAHANEYSSVINSVDTSGPPFNVKFQQEYLEYDVDADGLVVLPFDVFNFVPFVQFQVMAEVAGATPAQITNAEVTYGYGG